MGFQSKSCNMTEEGFNLRDRGGGSESGTPAPGDDLYLGSTDQIYT